MLNRKVFAKKLPKIAVMAKHSCVSDDVVKKLISLNCAVVVITEDIDNWKKIEVENNTNLLVINERASKKYLEEFKFDYIVCIASLNLFPKSADNFLESDNQKVSLAFEIAKEDYARVLFTFPFQQVKLLTDKINFLADKILKERNIFAAVIFLGDVFSDSESCEGNYLIDLMLNKRLRSGELIYPLTSESASDFLVRALFSLRAYGKKTALIGRPITVENIVRLLYREKSYSYSSDKKAPLRIEAIIDEKVCTDDDSHKIVAKAVSKLKPLKKTQTTYHEGPVFKVSYSRSANDKIRKNRQKIFPFIRKTLFKFLFLIILILFLPITFLLFGFVALFFAKASLIKADLNLAKKSFLVSSFFTRASYSYSQFLSETPLINGRFEIIGNVSKVSYQIAKVGLGTISLTNMLVDLSEEVVGNSSYDLYDYSTKMVLEADSLYKELGFLQGEIKESFPIVKKTVAFFLGNLDISDFQRKVFYLSDIFEEIPTLLGKDVPVTYVLIFQNNAIVRPTGGVIDSFAIASFSNGKLIDLKVYDVASADRNLAGYVEPPQPLKKYFSTDKWYLKDANWDPDFPTTAVRVEWFLDKEMDLSTFGIIAVNSEFIRKTTRDLVSLKLEIENKKITYDNLHEIISTSSFFSNYPQDNLVSNYRLIAENFLLETIKLDRKKKIRFFKDVLESLELKDIQVFSNDISTQRAISELGWDGRLTKIDCFENCYSDNLAIIESVKLIGNSDVKREGEFLVSLEEGLIKRKLILFFENPNEVSYQSYLRIVVPGDSGFGPIVMLDNEGKTEELAEISALRGFKEAEIFLEIPPLSSRALEFSWESGLMVDFSNKGEYLIFLRKQSGVAPYPVNIKMKHPKSSSLTANETDEYNIELSQDKILRIFWEKNE